MRKYNVAHRAESGLALQFTFKLGASRPIQREAFFQPQPLHRQLVLGPLRLHVDAPDEAGAFEERKDIIAVFALRPGHKYFDGVVEAENDRKEEYGEQRLLFMVNTGMALSPAQLLQNIIADLDRFVAGAPQHDDVTCMLVKMR